MKVGWDGGRGMAPPPTREVLIAPLTLDSHAPSPRAMRATGLEPARPRGHRIFGFFGSRIRRVYQFRHARYREVSGRAGLVQRWPCYLVFCVTFRASTRT